MREILDNIFLAICGLMVLIVANNIFEINKSYDNIEKELQKNEQLTAQLEKEIQSFND